MASRREEHVEILVHVSAPSRTKDDEHYRNLAAAYLDFQPRTITRLDRPRGEKTAPVLSYKPARAGGHTRNSLLANLDRDENIIYDSQPRHSRSYYSDLESIRRDKPVIADDGSVPVKRQRLAAVPLKLSGADTPPSSEDEDNVVKSGIKYGHRDNPVVIHDGSQSTDSPILSFSSVVDNRASPRLPTKTRQAAIPTTPPEIIEIADSQPNGSRILDSQGKRESQSSIITEIPDSHPSDVMIPEFNSPSRVMEHYLITMGFCRPLGQSAHASEATTSSVEGGDKRAGVRSKTPSSPTTRTQEAELVSGRREGTKERKLDNALETADPISTVSPTKPNYEVEGDTTVADETRVEETILEDGSGGHQPEVLEKASHREIASTTSEQCPGNHHPSTSSRDPTDSSSSSISRKRTREPVQESELTSEFTENNPRLSSWTTFGKVAITDSGDSPRKRPRLSQGLPPHPVTRADSEPLRRNPTNKAIKSAALARSASDQCLQKPTPIAAQVRFFNALEILSPHPPTSLETIEPWSLLTDRLKILASDLNINKRYRPSPSSRSLRPFERGYWFIDCSEWTDKLRYEAWVFLSNWIGNGLAGWGTRCWRDEGRRWIRLYCFGEVAGHTYLLLYLASCRNIKYVDVDWVAGGGEVAVTAMART